MAECTFKPDLGDSSKRASKYSSTLGIEKPLTSPPKSARDSQKTQ